MEIKVGTCYFRKKGLVATVRKVLGVTETKVDYVTLHGPILNKPHRGSSGTKYGSCSIRGFKRWAQDEIEEAESYKHLDGATILPTFIVLSTKGDPILRCGYKRAQFYLRKGYAKIVSPGVLQYTNDVTEKRLAELYGPELTEFFMQVKNDKCCVCGCDINLTRHHIVPQRHVKKIPIPWRNCISNVLFICIPCHKLYEDRVLVDKEPEITLEDPFAFVKAWRDHFIRVMDPQHLPKGWEIITVKNVEMADGFEEAGRRDEGHRLAEPA